MASKGEYFSSFDSEIDSIMSFPAGTKADVLKHAAEARRRVRRARDNFRRDISNRWRDRFREIKTENDQLEKDLTEAFKAADLNVDERAHDQLVGLQR